MNIIIFDEGTAIEDSIDLKELNKETTQFHGEANT